MWKLAGPWETNESLKVRENPWAECGLCLCVSPPLPIARLRLLKVPGHGNLFCSGNLYAKNRSSVRACAVARVAGCRKWPCQTAKGREMQRLGKTAHVCSIETGINTPHPRAARVGGSGCWSIPPATAHGEFLSSAACVALSFSCLTVNHGTVKKLILSGLRAAQPPPALPRAAAQKKMGKTSPGKK